MSKRASRQRGNAAPESPKAHVLYLSYDGMCDPLGGSQVLPYLFGLAGRGHRITLVSFEKHERTARERSAVRSACAAAEIDWRPLAYHKRPPLVSTLYDIRQMRSLAFGLHERQSFDFIHCRSYLPALVGLSMKRRFGTPFIFDMRGFWADERVDGGMWKLWNPLHWTIYNYFKRRERDFIREADHIVSLTEEGKRVLLDWSPEGPPISLIPCCVENDAFPPITEDQRGKARRWLGIADSARVAAFLGSFGGWNMVNEMLDFFRVQLARDPNSIFMIITRESANEIVATAERRGISRDRLLVRPASRAQVPRFLAAADYALFFIKPTFSKKASSPTKMGEFLALELPMITNGGVGDIDQIMAQTGAGVVVTEFCERAYAVALDALEQLKPDMDRWRSATHRWLDLSQAIDRYDSIYAALCGAGASR
jgi:glycosyltransferase involved in cell wall biosynthesis